MRKLAVFVEGQTELIFAHEFIIHFGHPQHVNIDTAWAIGPRGNRRLVTSRINRNWGQKYYVQIVDSGSDEQVLSDINERYDGLIEAGFDAIIGIRDARPRIKRLEIPKVVDSFNKYVKSNPVRPALVIATMEIEAWFLAEHRHFPKIHPKITTNRIIKKFGFNPSTLNTEARPNPKSDMKKIYALEKVTYGTSEDSVYRTVKALDPEGLLVDVSQRVPSLGSFVTALNQFFV